MADQHRLRAEPTRNPAALRQAPQRRSGSVQPYRQAQSCESIELRIDHNDRRQRRLLTVRTAGTGPALKMETLLVRGGGNDCRIDPDQGGPVVVDGIQDTGPPRAVCRWIPAERCRL